MRARTALGVATIVALSFVCVLDPIGSRAAPEPPGGDPPPPPRVAAVDEPAPPAAPEISMSWCAAAGCTLTFTFSAELPGARLVFDPVQDGTATWRSPTVLEFTPKAGAFLAGHAFDVSVPGTDFNAHVQVPYFEAANKIASWPVVPGRPRFVAFLNGFVDQLGRGPLFALYDQPVDPAAIARTTRVAVGGRPLAVRVQRPSSSAQIFDDPIPLANLVTLEVARLPADGERVAIELPSVDDDGNPAPHQAELMVNTTLATPGWSDGVDDYARTKGMRTPLSAHFTVPFTNQVTAKAFERHLRITPAPRSMGTYVRGTRGQVDAELEPGVLYQLSIDTGLRDVLGNPLITPASASFRAQDREPALAMPDELALEKSHALLPVKVTNLGRATLTTQRFPTAAAWLAARATGSPYCAGPQTTIDLTAPLNQEATREVPLESGLYCVAVQAQGRGSQARADAEAAGFVQVASAAITAKVSEGTVFAWATRLADGAPLASTAVALLDGAGKQVATGTTDADGTVTLTGVAAASAAGLDAPHYLVVGDGEMVAPIADGVMSNAYQFGLDGVAGGPGPLSAAIFTERGVYRPGEQVDVKALVRDPISHRAATGELAFEVADPRGERVLTRTVALDEFGGAALAIALKDDAAVGEYTIHAEQDGHTAVRSFRVEEYRVPTFAVAVATDEAWTAGARAHAAISAAYLHGGALAGREVSWELTRTPEPFAPAAWRGFVFDTRAASGEVAGAQSITHGKGHLDGQGRLVVGFAADHGSKAGPMRYAVDASVADVDRQVYAGRLSRVVHPADLYVGVARPRQRLYSAGDTVTVPIVAVATDGQARAGVAVTATLERIEYRGVTRVTDEGSQRVNQRVALATGRRCAVTSKRHAVECKLTVPAAGEYVVRVSARDGQRRPVEAAFDFSASGDNPVVWPRFDHERITIVADRDRYAPGDVARLIVQSPFPRAHGLLVLERDGVIEHRRFEIDGDTPELRVPITEAGVPNLYASVILIRGRVHDQVDATGFPTGAPAFRMGYTELAVDPAAHRLAVAVEADSAKAAPGTTLGVDVYVKGADGQPRAGQATIMVVDEAVLGLTRYRTPDPIAELFRPRPLAVRTADSRLDLLNARRERREQVFPSGDGDEQRAADSEHLPSDLRRLFKSTAFYDTAVAVGPDGHARVAFALPDNLTTYRIMAVAVDPDTGAGSGEGQVVVHKPLMVQPALPRFVHPGDRLRLDARVLAQGDHGGKVELTASFDGVELDGAAPATQSAEVAAGGEVGFAYPLVVPETAGGTATVRLSARLGSDTDSVQLALPILDPGTKRKLVVSKLVTAKEVLSLPLPADRQPGTVAVELTASTTALSELKDAVEYLMEYPNGCIEQTTSTAYPLVVLKDLLPEMGVTVDDAALAKFSEAGVKRILSFQTTSGGLSYWPGSDEPHAFATAFGLTVLIEAKARGYDVPDAALARMADYLESALRQGQITGEMPHLGMADADTRAFFVMTLGRLGRPQPAYVATLWSKRDQLTAFGLAFLGVAVSEGSGDRALLQPILDAVHAAATEAPREAYFTGEQGRGGWSFDSPLRTHGGALLAFAVAGTDHALAGKLLTGLLARRVGGLWGNTQEDVFGMMAITRLTSTAGSDPAVFTVRVNGKAIDAARIEAPSDRMKRLVLTADELEGHDQVQVELSNGGKPVFATMRLTYVAKLDDANRAARSAGFTVARRYETADGQSIEGRTVKLGSLVRVRLTVTAAAANHYVAIDDKLPAGLEPLNAALATTETVTTGPPTPALSAALARLSYSELRDARVAFFLDELPAGTYELVYLARATTPGHFIRPAATAEAMYQTDVNGASAIDAITIE